MDWIREIDGLSDADLDIIFKYKTGGANVLQFLEHHQISF